MPTRRNPAQPSTAIYARVSSKSQDLAAQIPDLKGWQKAHPREACEWFTDHLSGKTMDRPGFNRMMELVNAGVLKRIVVWRLDRLGRTARGLTALFEELQERGVNLVSLRDALDLSTAAGRLMAHVLASVAVYENEVRSERIRAGISAARAKGKRWGGSMKGRRLKVDDYKVRTIGRMHRERQPVAIIARAVDLSRPTVYKVLAELKPPQTRGR